MVITNDFPPKKFALFPFRSMIEHYEPIYVIIQHGISMKVHPDHHRWSIIYHPVEMGINSWIVAFIFQLRWGKKRTRISKLNCLFNFRSANLNDMVSSIVDENSEFYQNGMIPPFSQYQSPSMMMPFAWSNGGPSSDQYVQQMKKYIFKKIFLRI